MFSRNNLKLGEVSGPWGPSVAEQDSGSQPAHNDNHGQAQKPQAEQAPVEDLLSFTGDGGSGKGSGNLLSDFEGLSFNDPTPAQPAAPTPAPTQAPAATPAPADPPSSSFSFLSAGNSAPAAPPARTAQPSTPMSGFNFLNQSSSTPAASQPAPAPASGQSKPVMMSQADRSSMAVSDIFSLGEDLEREKSVQRKPTAFDKLLPFSSQPARPRPSTTSVPQPARPAYPPRGMMGGPQAMYGAPGAGFPRGPTPMHGGPSGVPPRPGMAPGFPGGQVPRAPTPGFPASGAPAGMGNISIPTPAASSPPSSGFGFLNSAGSAAGSSPSMASSGGAPSGAAMSGMVAGSSVIDSMSPEAMATWDTSSNVQPSQRQLNLRIPGIGAAPSSGSTTRPVRKGPSLNSLSGRQQQVRITDRIMNSSAIGAIVCDMAMEHWTIIANDDPPWQQKQPMSRPHSLMAFKLHKKEQYPEKVSHSGIGSLSHFTTKGTNADTTRSHNPRARECIFQQPRPSLLEKAERAPVIAHHLDGKD